MLVLLVLPVSFNLLFVTPALPPTHTTQPRVSPSELLRHMFHVTLVTLLRHACTGQL